MKLYDKKYLALLWARSAPYLVCKFMNEQPEMMVTEAIFISPCFCVLAYFSSSLIYLFIFPLVQVKVTRTGESVCSDPKLLSRYNIQRNSKS